MEISRANQTQLSTRSSAVSKQTQIKLLLAKLAVRRQAQIGEAEFGVYSEDLEKYSLPSIEAGLDWIASHGRRDGETAFPEIETIREAIRTCFRASHATAALDEINARRAHKEAHPELYETTAEELEMAKTINERFGFERPKEIKTSPVLMACPHCSRELPVSPNIRFWTPAELRSHADTLEQLEKIAKNNRDASLEAQREPMTEVV